MEDLEHGDDAQQALGVLEAVLGEEINSVPVEVSRALRERNYDAALAAANEAFAETGSSRPAVAVAYAMLLTGGELVDEALDVLRRAEVEHEGELPVRLARAEALVVDSQFDSAKKVLDGMYPNDTTEAVRARFIADLYLELDCVERAADWYHVALEGGEDDFEVAFRLAKLRSELGDRQRAAEAMEIAAQKAGDDALLWKSAADTFDELDRLDDAIRCRGRYLKLKPQDEEAQFDQGLALWIEDRHREAVEFFEAVVDLNPGHRTAWRKLGESRLAAGHPEQALAAFERVVKLDADDIEAMKKAAVAARQSGDVEASIGWAERAVQADVDDGESRRLLASGFLARGRAERAAELLEELIDDAEADDAEVMGMLAVAKLTGGDVDDATEYARQAVQLDGGGEWLVDFCTALLKAGGVEEVREFLDRDLDAGAGWQFARPMFDYLIAGLADNSQRAEKAAEAFGAQSERFDDALPVDWNFQSWEALGFRLDRPYQKTFDAMLGVVEGRKSPDSDLR